MKIAYFDTIAGISGDMTLGAFISAGVSLDYLSNEISKLDLHGVEFQATHLERSGITAVKLDVIISDQHHNRNIHDILEIISRNTLSDRVTENAKKIFMQLAHAEAKIHNMSIDDVHFHEVGALDAIVDIVGAAICLEKFGIKKVYTSPIKLGSGGFVDAAHGQLPLPAPAVAEILKGYPTVLTDVPFELTTPTGAAIVKAISSGVLSNEQISFEDIGYGAGSGEIKSIPNLLRVMIGELEQSGEEEESVIVETNIDDMNPEIYPFVIEQLLSHGADDAFLIPIIMKKGRPGVLLSAITSRSKLDHITEVFFSQTSTLGIRMQHINRRKVVREQREIESKLGKIKVKVVKYNGKERFIPEYEECRRLAIEKNIPLIEIYRNLEIENFP
jgi:uncharacterized protein (TIGR00299 family) protein